MSHAREPEIIHHGGAVLYQGRELRLKDLLAPARLGAGDLRVLQASARGDELILGLSDGGEASAALPRVPPAAPAPPDLVLENAGQILCMDEAQGVGLRPGGAVVCGGGRILQVLPERRPRATLPAAARRVDAAGGVVSPGLVDPHTHPVFAGERSLEFGLKAAGKTYLEIHKAGGGILSTVRATRAATFEDLARGCAQNLSRLLSWGVTTCEAKSGYDLTVEGELRLLQVLRRVGDTQPVDVEATLLGAHALPPERAGRRQDYLREITEGMIPRAAAEGLARHCDAYCEDGAFTPAEVEQVFAAARAAGLGLRLHAEQFTDQGGAQLAARLGAASADHLERIGAAGIAALAAGGTVAVLLPGAALARRCPWPPARAILDAGGRVALGTDLNPGSSMTAALPLMMSLACMQLGLTCEEAWRAVTVEAARSLGRADIGRLAPGCRADLVVFDAPDYRYVPYHYGENHARLVFKDGRQVLPR